MQNVQMMSAAFCDHLMERVEAEGLDEVKSAVVMVVDYFAHEMARAGNTDLATAIFAASHEIDRAFAKSVERNTPDIKLVS